MAPRSPRANFKRAIDRTANKALASPGAPFIIDPNGTNIVGAKKVNDGKATSVSGVTAKGNKLTINLTKPDGTFMAKITMPFFQATSLKLPLTKEVVNVSKTNLPSAGPYYMTRNDPDKLTQLRQNPNWKTGPGRTRPRNLAGLDVQWNLNEQTLFNQTKANEIDEDPVMPAAEVQGIANQYGVNKSRFWTKPINCTGYLPMNTSRALFKGNLALRQAINYAIDRKSYAAQAGPYAGSPWTHIFNPGVPGWRNVSIYKQNVTKAKKLAKGHFKTGKITVGYRSSGTINPAQAQIVKRDLQQARLQRQQHHHEGLLWRRYLRRHGPQRTPTSTWVSRWVGARTTRTRTTGSTSCCTASPSRRRTTSTTPTSTIPSGTRRWSRQPGSSVPKRLKVYGQMDLDIMNQAAPMAIERTYNNRYLFSNRVNPKSLVYQGIYQDFSIPAMALK